MSHAPPQPAYRTVVPQLDQAVHSLSSEEASARDGEGEITASTQTVALSALLFLYRDVLKQQLPYVSNIERARKPKRLPTVFTRDETRRIFANLEGTHWLIAGLLYGSGLRLMECLRLRVKDIDFTYAQITVRDGSPREIST